MSAWIMAVVCAEYAAIAFIELWKRNYPGFIIYFSYAVSGVGLIWATLT